MIHVVTGKPLACLLEERAEDLMTGERAGSLGGRRQVAGQRIEPPGRPVLAVIPRSTKVS